MQGAVQGQESEKLFSSQRIQSIWLVRSVENSFFFLYNISITEENTAIIVKEFVDG